MVSFLNARPLIAGMDRAADIELVFDVPARLPALVDEDRVDAALVPVVDLVRGDRSWKIISDACIGSDGETLTVRVFSRVPAADVRVLRVDCDSHTSVILAAILWRELYGVSLDMVTFTEDVAGGDCEAVLLIGDKVVSHRLRGYPFETDLGAAWKSLTDLPFVFAVWATRQAELHDGLAERLSRARDEGVGIADSLAATFGPEKGWPVELARQYLSERMKYTLGERQRAGMVRFIELAKAADLIVPGRELIFA